MHQSTVEGVLVQNWFFSDKEALHQVRGADEVATARARCLFSTLQVSFALALFWHVLWLFLQAVARLFTPRRTRKGATLGILLHTS